MPRQKRKSTILTQAEQRLLGMKSISLKLDLGGGCTTEAVEKQVNEVREKLLKYHALLSQADAASNELERSEKVLAQLSKKVLKGVAVKYDEDSDQYEMVGGVRASDRKRSPRRRATLANA